MKGWGDRVKVSHTCAINAPNPKASMRQYVTPTLPLRPATPHLKASPNFLFNLSNLPIPNCTQEMKDEMKERAEKAKAGLKKPGS